MLERLGVNTRGQTMQTKNVAAVMVTANLPAFAAPGSRIDVSVSAPWATPRICKAAPCW